MTSISERGMTRVAGSGTAGETLVEPVVPARCLTPLLAEVKHGGGFDADVGWWTLAEPK